MSAGRDRTGLGLEVRALTRMRPFADRPAGVIAVETFPGRTVGNVIAVMEAGHPHPRTRQGFRVEIGRVRDWAELVTDEAVRLRYGCGINLRHNEWADTGTGGDRGSGVAGCPGEGYGNDMRTSRMAACRFCSPDRIIRGRMGGRKAFPRHFGDALRGFRTPPRPARAPTRRGMP